MIYIFILLNQWFDFLLTFHCFWDKYYDLHFTVIETCNVIGVRQVIWSDFCFLITQIYWTSETNINQHFQWNKTINMIIFLDFFLNR